MRYQTFPLWHNLFPWKWRLITQINKITFTMGKNETHIYAVKAEMSVKLTHITNWTSLQKHIWHISGCIHSILKLYFFSPDQTLFAWSLSNVQHQTPVPLFCRSRVYCSSVLCHHVCLHAGVWSEGAHCPIFRTWGSLWQVGLIGMVSGLRRRAFNSVLSPPSTFSLCMWSWEYTCVCLCTCESLSIVCFCGFLSLCLIWESVQNVFNSSFSTLLLA